MADVLMYASFFHQITGDDERATTLMIMLSKLFYDKTSNGCVYFMIGPQETCDVLENIIFNVLKTTGTPICGKLPLQKIRNTTALTRKDMSMQNEVYRHVNIVSNYDPTIKINDYPLRYLSEGMEKIFGLRTMESKTIFLGPQPPNIKFETTYIRDRTIYIELKPHGLTDEGKKLLYEKTPVLFNLLIDIIPLSSKIEDKQLISDVVKQQTQKFILERS